MILTEGGHFGPHLDPPSETAKVTQSCHCFQGQKKRKNNTKKPQSYHSSGERALLATIIVSNKFWTLTRSTIQSAATSRIPEKRAVHA